MHPDAPLTAAVPPGSRYMNGLEPDIRDYDNPNTQALSKKLNLSSEMDCRNLLLRDITALPVREPLAPSSIASPTQPPLMS
ncbi:uncharacterized protein B0J16DRAFT_1657 [Fusarium flagelliforme]|uniref:uncharacterized protein n=1 Tax=Fusarium flagelliforme TaxID=2675880 RepID=UPI001E8E6348|nr:uncharacterized protein B0J16DRAFT_1657 [Fusarium flagelliforme]KAH7196550.1 hypothetical protein B0J16DRAFT_1657 [Fusarium flagelliforme]